ncbi:MAG TPA: hypothetical protein VLS89_05760 [Candidatus Nanopelagicales bacterium]|nr:hypothetical protein [Candidatus Nanopelagicales bacterium]
MQPSYMRAPVRAPANALEIGVNTGYTQGFGDIAQGQNIGNTADAGLGAGLTLAYRASPYFSIGANAQYQAFNADQTLADDTSIMGMTVGPQATFHFAPYQRVDPHISLGTGYRMLWQSPEGPNNNVLIHGFQLAKLNAGLDIRVNDSVALGPMIGADVNMFVWRNPEGARGNQRIDDLGVNTFVYAGLQGRFDVGGQRVTRVTAVGSR